MLLVWCTYAFYSLIRMREVYDLLIIHSQDTSCFSLFQNVSSHTSACAHIHGEKEGALASPLIRK